MIWTFTDVAYRWLFIIGIYQLFSSIVYALDSNELWFGRMVFSSICIGLSAIIYNTKREED